MKLSTTCGAAALVAVLAVGNSASAQSVTLSSLLLAGGTITSGDLIFSSFGNFTQGGNIAVGSDQITVTVVSGGIEFSCSQWTLSGASLSYYLTLGFNVATTDGSFINGLASTMSGTYSQGKAAIDDAVSIAGGSALGNADPYIDRSYLGSSLLTSSVSFSQESAVSVAKTLSLSTANSPSASMIVNNFSDTFVTTVPEPSSMALGLLGSFGGMGLFLLRRRN